LFAVLEEGQGVKSQLPFKMNKIRRKESQKNKIGFVYREYFYLRNDHWREGGVIALYAANDVVRSTASIPAMKDTTWNSSHVRFDDIRLAVVSRCLLESNVFV
jgi:hypothetical protein